MRVFYILTNDRHCNVIGEDYKNRQTKIRTKREINGLYQFIRI